MAMQTIRILAGAEAYRQIRERGLNAGDIQVITGAAGGPKWLALSQIDRYLFGNWFRERSEPLHLIGSSAGAWRLAAASTKDPASAFDRFEELYIDQQYSLKPTAADVSAKSLSIIRGFLGDYGAPEVLSHSAYRLNILVNRCRGPLATDQSAVLKTALGTVGMGSVLFKPAITAMIDRYIGHDRRSPAPLAAGLARTQFHLTEDNLANTLLASGSIPVVMEGVRDLSGTDTGTYRDGGLLDYHIDLPFELPSDKLILCPHFIPRIVPGWFDRFAPWRKARFSARTVLIVPSDTFISSLPNGKIPCRRDFYSNAGRDSERKKTWKQVVSECRRTADELAGILESGQAASVVEPMP